MTTVDSNTQHVRLAGRDFEIPRRFLQESEAYPWWLRWLPGLDTGTRELLLTINASDVANFVSSYKTHEGQYSDDLHVRLVVLTAEERRRYADSAKFADIWNANGSYRGEIIDFNPSQGFRVFRRVEYPNSWELFTISPKVSRLPADIFSFWLGSCLKLHSSLTSTGVIVDCSSYALAGDIAVNFRTTDQNIQAVPEIRKYLIHLVSQWQQARVE
jgi:hypothetical protein